MKDCIFCKIVDKELPSRIIYEDNKFIAFKDVNPKAPVHLLIIPKKHIPSVNHIEPQDADLVGKLILVAQKIAKKEGVSESGYRLIFNIGKNAGQTVDHLHLHLLGGKKLPWA
jgi:histidine triad (HIT) family protein